MGIGLRWSAPASMRWAGLSFGVAMLVCASASAIPFRSFDGTGNNFANPDFGMAGSLLLRLVAPDYGDGFSTPAGAGRPSPRVISNGVVAQASSEFNKKGASDFIWQWGQFVDHDLDLVPTNPAEPFPIPVPPDDPAFAPATELAFSRSVGVADANGVRQQPNSLTAWIDGSMVYGSSQARADSLRSFQGGRLATSTDDLLPLDGTGLFRAGDDRVNEQVALTAMHTLFMREHNRIADGLTADGGLDPVADDEIVFQTARAIVGAEIQSITFNEFLPMVLGTSLGTQAYDDTIDPGVSNEFAGAAFRMGHTLLSSILLRLEENGGVIADGNLALRDAFFAPDEIIDNGIDSILRGLAAQPAQEIDSMIVDDVRNFLFGPPGAGGLDLASLNLQRGRDHGLPSFNAVRIALGLGAAEFGMGFFEPEADLALQAVYGDINDVDLWIGAISEAHVPGAMVGIVAFTIIADQFMRARDGDRFWYETMFGGAMLDALNNTRLSDIILRNTGIQTIQANVFEAVPRVPEPATLALLGAGMLAAAYFRRRRARS